MIREASGVMPKDVLNMFTAPKCNLFPMQETVDLPPGWERISVVVDSGASITALHPQIGKAYKLEESEASKRGDAYEIANGDKIPNLGRKRMAVLTREGTLRGFEAQCADVSSPLESVRQLVSTQHAVVFGMGENGDEHYIVNKVSGEINILRDDGTNYLHDMIIVPPDDVGKVYNSINADGQPFGGPA